MSHEDDDVLKLIRQELAPRQAPSRQELSGRQAPSLKIYDINEDEFVDLTPARLEQLTRVEFAFGKSVQLLRRYGMINLAQTLVEIAQNKVRLDFLDEI